MKNLLFVKLPWTTPTEQMNPLHLVLPPFIYTWWFLYLPIKISTARVTKTEF